MSLADEKGHIRIRITAFSMTTQISQIIDKTTIIYIVLHLARAVLMTFQAAPFGV